MIFLKFIFKFLILFSFASYGMAAMDNRGGPEKVDCNSQFNIPIKTDTILPLGGPNDDGDGKGHCSCAGYTYTPGGSSIYEPPSCTYKLASPEPKEETVADKTNYTCPAGWKGRYPVPVGSEHSDEKPECIPEKSHYVCYIPETALISGKCDLVDFYLFPHEFKEKGLSMENCRVYKKIKSETESITPSVVIVKELRKRCEQDICKTEKNPAFDSSKSIEEKYQDKRKCEKSSGPEQVCTQNYACKNIEYQVICDNLLLPKDKLEKGCGFKSAAVTSNEIYDACMILNHPTGFVPKAGGAK